MANKPTAEIENASSRLAPATPLRTCSETGELDASGASPSNTAPSNYQNTRILRSGIDSLYLSYPGELRPELDKTLETLKQAAQSDDAAARKDATILITDQPYTVSSKGMGRFAYVLTNNWFHLKVSSVRASRLPLFHAQVRSEVLTLAPFEEILETLGNDAQAMGGVSQPTVSRVDLCVDFVTDFDFEKIPVEYWVTRAKDYNKYYSNKNFSGYVFGQKGRFSCRLYDKTLEIKEKSKKFYMYDLWREQGWDEESRVWRLEFQVDVEGLRELEVRDVPKLVELKNSIWKYCTTKWLKLSESIEGQNSTRWPVSPLWQLLAEATFNSVPAIPLRRIRYDQSPTDERLFIHGLGAITSFMARERIDDIELGMNAFKKAAGEYHRAWSHHTGKYLNDYVQEKVQSKRTKFNARLASDYDLETGELK